MAFNLQNIKFLQGSEAKLKSLTSVQNGAFYLTNDTYRLYIGDNGKAVPVNQGVIVVEDQTALNAIDKTTVSPGQFYLIKTGNILCTLSNGQWVQINPTTKLTAAATSASKTGKNVQLDTQVTSTNGNPISSFILAEGAGIALAVTTPEGGGVPTITVSSTGSGGIETRISAKDSAENADFVEIAQTITITPVDGTDPTTTTTTAFKLAKGENIKSVVAKDGTVTINAAQQAVTKMSFVPAGETENGFNLAIEQNSGNTNLASELFDPTVGIGKSGAEGTGDIHFVNGKATLDVYTTTQADAAIEAAINAKLAAADAMTYKGTVNSAEALGALTQVKNGDTYKVSAEFEYLATKVKVGDLLIAQGTEGEDGFLPESFKFDIVPSGNEYETKVDPLAHGIAITDGASTPTTLGSIQLAAGSQVVLDDNGTGKEKTITVSHATIAQTTKERGEDGLIPATEGLNTVYTDATNGATKTIRVVKDVKTTNNGHVTEVVIGEEIIKDTDVALKSTSNTITKSKDEKGVTVSTAVVDNLDRAATGASFDLISNSLAVAATGNTITVEMTWGEF